MIDGPLTSIVTLEPDGVYTATLLDSDNQPVRVEDDLEACRWARDATDAVDLMCMLGRPGCMFVCHGHSYAA